MPPDGVTVERWPATHSLRPSARNRGSSSSCRASKLTSQSCGRAPTTQDYEPLTERAHRRVNDRLSAGEVTRLLREWKDRGSAQAEAALFALVERELVKVADALRRQHPVRAAKIDPRELVNEAYLALTNVFVTTAIESACC